VAWHQVKNPVYYDAVLVPDFPALPFIGENMKKYKTIKDVLEAVKSGELDESKLVIIQDNDRSDILNGMDEEGNDIENCIYEGKGYRDTNDLWPLVFPKATVEWC